MKNAGWSYKQIKKGELDASLGNDQDDDMGNVCFQESVVYFSQLYQKTIYTQCVRKDTEHNLCKRILIL